MNKKILNILFFWLWAVAMMAQTAAGGSGSGTDDGLYTVSTAITPSKAGTVSYPGSRYQPGEDVYIYTEANTSYRFKYWLEGDTQVSTESHFYYTMPARDVTLTAVYEYDPESPADPAIPGTLTLKASPSRGGSFSHSSGRRYPEGTNLRLYAYANTSYKFNHWEYKGQVVSENYWFDFTMPADAAELVAVFTYNPANPQNPGSNPWDEESGQLIIDDFQEGNLSDAIYNATGNSDKMESLIVAGRVSSNDIRNLSQFPFANIDLSRCAGATAIESWSFEGNENLTSIALPASIQNIYYDAFYNCTSLTTLSCYATIPPTLGNNAFEGVNTANLLVYVPAGSVQLYQATAGWRDLNILPFGTEVTAIEVDLPDGSSDGRFKNMFIELVNVNSGQRQRYVITNEVAYTFRNIMFNTKWNIYVKTPNDEVLGSKEGFEVGESTAGYRYQFPTLIEPQTIQAKVMAGDEDVTSQVSFTWRNAQGAFIGQNSSVSGIVPISDTVVVLRTTLPQSLAMKYQLPEEVNYSVKASDNIVLVNLVPLPKATLMGRVVDLRDKSIIANAVVTLSQTLNGRYSKTMIVKTNADGIYTFQDVFDAPSSVTAVATEYVSATKSYDELTLIDGVATLEDLELKSINGVRITLNYTYTLSAIPGATPQTQPFDDVQNVTYTVFDVTADKAITQFNVQYPQIVLLEDVEQGDVLKLTATSRKGAFNTVEAQGKVNQYDQASVTFNILQLGQIQATFVSSENVDVTGILYDANGKFVRSDSYVNRTLLFTDLADGSYKLVSMGSSRFFNTIYDLGKFRQSGLVEGIDYVVSDVVVESGVISVVKVALVPFFNEAKLYFTGANTSFTVNKNSLTVGTYLTMNGRIDFKSTYVNDVTDVEFIVDLPESCSFVESSVMVGNGLASYTIDGNRVIIPVSNKGDRVRFCVIPTVGGDYAPSAYAHFRYNGEEVMQPIGQAPFTVEDLTINVPSVVATPTLPVNGSAFGKSRVQIYDNDVFIGETTALANGSWATSCELVDPEDNSKHNIYARVTTLTGLEMLSETKTVLYDEDAVQVDNVTMYYSNPEVNNWRGKNYQMKFDFQNPSTRPFTYVYYIYNRSFTFTLEFNRKGDTQVQNVVILVKTGDGRWHSLQPEYNLRKGQYVISANFGNMYDGIVPVNVAVEYTPVYDDVLGERVLVYSGYPDCDVPIDPSGYVYEGVPSNRIQGVTATCYYKETVEDMYGDLHENIVLWDAAEYAQENPLFTDEDGFYRWDVPQGLWQVKFEKEGYVTTYSDWLPVPPPQLDVNIAMVQNRQPNVNPPTVLEDGVIFEFDKFMMSEDLNTDNIKVAFGGTPVSGVIEFLDKEEAYEDGPEYASKVKFKITDETVLNSSKDIDLDVQAGVRSYAGANMQNPYHQRVPYVPVVTDITTNAGDLLLVGNGNKKTLQVTALPNDAAPGKTLIIRPLSTFISTIKDLELVDDSYYEVTLDANGMATLTVNGEMPGTTAFQLSVMGTDVENRVDVKVATTYETESAAPYASRGNGSKLYRGTYVTLDSDNEEKVIRYTTDGMEPDENSPIYTAPILVDDAMTIKAFAQVDGLPASDTQTFSYTIRSGSQTLQLAKGWSWISHHVASDVAVGTFPDAVQEIKSQTRSAIRDNVYGLFGNLTALTATEAYKVKASEATEKTVSGDAFNITTGIISLKKGWNWLSFPLEEGAAPDEALANLTATDGDRLVAHGQDGFAIYDNGEWIGSLTVMSPGKGYMLQAAQASDFLFDAAYVSNAPALARGRLKLSKAPWSVDDHAYPDVMPICAQLFREDAQTSDAEFTVAAFAGTECRGIGTYVKGVIFMSVCGEGSEDISFMAFNNDTEEIVNVNETLSFNANGVGSYREPYALHLGQEADGIEEHYNQLGIWPTVATTEVTVSLGGKAIDHLTLTSIDGKTVYSATPGVAQTSVNVSRLPVGIYIVAAKSGSDFFYKKMMKVNQ